MRRFLVVGILVTTLGMATPAQAEVIWWDQPPLPYNPPVTFVDTTTVRTARLDAWREARDRALDSWGIPYIVTEDRGTYTPFDALVSEQRNGIPGVIRIGRDVSGACVNYGGYYASVEGGVAVICLMTLWWKPHNQVNTAGALAHEVGHALGLGHSTTGVMGGALKPNPEEVAAVQAIYT